MVREFRWLSGEDPPARYDLRRRGWYLHDAGNGTAEAPCPVLVEPRTLPPAEWLQLTGGGKVRRESVLLVGIDEPDQRARLLRLGFGDVVGSAITLVELDARLRRVAAQARTLPMSRTYGLLTLALVARDGFIAGRRLGLHPREFALVWRLSETPGHAVSAERLLADVWQLTFRPETNSLAVHVSRLRAKLRIAGLEGLIETTPDGAYRLIARPDAAPDTGLDAYLRMGEEADEEDAGPCVTSSSPTTV
jgi:two-component system, OmpR family, response regulator